MESESVESFNMKNIKSPYRYILVFALAAISSSSGCATVKKIFVTEEPQKVAGPIQNPFGYYDSASAKSENVTLRSKKGDRSVEVEIPQNSADRTDFAIPVNAAFKNDRSLASVDDRNIDDSYRQRKTTASDREITSNFPKTVEAYEGDRREIETQLGVMPSEDETPDQDQSYLAGLDRVKQLFRSTRFEAALLETDEMLRMYPTDPKIYEMRGTLFDRIGKQELALRSWEQALKLDPQNLSLKKFIERKQQRRAIASNPIGTPKESKP